MRHTRCECCGAPIYPDDREDHLTNRCRHAVLGVSTSWRLKVLQKKVDRLNAVLDRGEEYSKQARLDKLRRELEQLQKEIG
jgi:hypothetical protein